MDNSLLLEKLKGGVNNQNLKKVGVLYLVYSAGESIANDNVMSITTGNSGTCVISVSSGGSFTLQNDSTERTEYELQPNSQYVLIFKNASYNIYISNKYNISIISIGSTSASRKISYKDFNDFSYVKAIRIEGKSEAPCSCTGSIESLNETLLERIILANYPNVTGDIAHLSDLTSLQTALFTNVNLHGSIDSLASHPSLSSLEFDNVPVSGNIASMVHFLIPSKIIKVKDTQISGRIEDLAEALVSQSTFSYGINVIGSRVTLNEVLYNYNATIARKQEEPNIITISRSNTTLATYDIANDTWTYA